MKTKYGIGMKTILVILIISLFIPCVFSQPEKPSAQLNISTKTTNIGDVITFDASLSDWGSGNYVEFQMSYGDGFIDTWQANPTFAHSYDSYGEFEVTLEVRNNAGTSSLKDTVVIRPESPIASLIATIDGKPFDSSKEIIKGVTEVSFSGEGSLDTDLSSTNLEYNFYFGDGRNTGWQKSSTTKTIYSSTGTFNAYLNIRNSSGAVSPKSSAIEINVRVSVFAIINADPSITADRKQTIIFDVSDSFDANPDNKITEYIIEYGDNVRENSSFPINFNHSYDRDGDFTVRLTVVNDKGESDTDVVEIKIGASVLFTALLWGTIGGALLFVIISFFLGARFIEEIIIMGIIGTVMGAVTGLIIYLLIVNWLLLIICIIIIVVIVFLIFFFFGGFKQDKDIEDEDSLEEEFVVSFWRKLPKKPR